MSKIKIKTLNAISSTGLQNFPQHIYEVGNDIENPDAILVRSQKMHDLSLPSSVKVIGRAGAGVNNIPVATLTSEGIPVFNTPGANANAVCELVLASMLLASRNIIQAAEYVRNLKGTDAELDVQVEKDKKQFVGGELLGKTLAVVGLGNIGVKLANAALHLGMNVIGYDPTITIHRAWELSSKVKQAHTIEEALTQADFISFHVPLTPETKNMVDASRLKLLKKNVTLLNFARHGVIDEVALLEALNQDKVFAYVCDFPSQDLKNHPRVTCLPHLGASTVEAEENCAVMIVNQVREFLEFGTIIYSVNFPAIEMPVNVGATRLAIVNQNVPNMVAQISSKIAEAKLNILSLLNKSRDDIAYTLIDVKGDVPGSLLTEISAITGVLQVRTMQM
jgi:D-3-phosphoglycerate dehydrogenase